MKRQLPNRLIRVATGTPEIDLEQRTIRSVIATKLLARDGGIVLPEGIITKFFEANPVVLAMHGAGMEANAPVVGRSLGLTRTAAGMESVTQFADTELGREYAYLYGVNEKREVFMRAWSFGWRTLAQEWWTREHAMQFLGTLWDEEAAAGIEEVWVAVKSEMHEYSAVPVGADRAALSRAYQEGVRSAGHLMAELDLAAAHREIGALKTFQGTISLRLEKLERDYLALRSDGAAAAAPGNTAELLNELDGLLRIAQATNQKK